MGSEAARPKRGFWRRLGHRVRKVFDVIDVIEFLTIVFRVVTMPFRLLTRLLDDLW